MLEVYENLSNCKMCIEVLNWTWFAIFIYTALWTCILRINPKPLIFWGFTVLIMFLMTAGIWAFIGMFWCDMGGINYTFELYVKDIWKGYGFLLINIVILVIILIFCCFICCSKIFNTAFKEKTNEPLKRVHRKHNYKSTSIGCVGFVRYNDIIRPYN